jgi:hypothetical protein
MCLYKHILEDRARVHHQVARIVYYGLPSNNGWHLHVR